MSRYKKASYNETELEEIEGVKPVLRPTRDERMAVIELFTEQQKNKSLNLQRCRKVLTDLLYNSLFLWENKKRTDKKEEGAQDITREDIEDFVIKNIFEVWLGVLDGLNIIDKKKLKELQKQQAEALKEKPLSENPN